MNERPGGEQKDSLTGMHDIGRQLIMGGASGQTAIVTTTTTSNGIRSSVLDSNSTGSAAQNGLHHPAAAAVTSEQGTAVNTNNNNNNNVVKRSAVIKCNSVNSGAAPSEYQSHVPCATMSDGPGRSEQVNPLLPRPETDPVVTVSSSSSSSEASASVVSSRSSSLSVSPNPMMLIRSEDEVAELEDARKVEPLKINLHHREPIRTVIKLTGAQSSEVANNHVPSSPKITIKPIPNPGAVVSSSTQASTEDEVVPKLHIRMNHNDTADHQEAIKLTIRNAGTSAATAVDASGSVSATTTENPIPKLTIRMPQPTVPRLTIKTNCLGAEEATHPTVPKLTIKVANDQAANSTAVAGAVSPSSAVISSSTTNNNSSSSSSGSTVQQQNEEEDESGSFQIVNSHQGNDAVPKLKVKLPRNTVVVPSEGEEESERSNSDSGDQEADEEQQQQQQQETPRIPKLTIKPIVASPPKIYGTNQANNEVHHQHRFAKSIPKEEVASRGTGDHNHKGLAPLDVSMTAGSNSVGPQSPRIILKINKNQNSIVSNAGGDSAAEEGQLKRHGQQEHVNNTAKRAKGPEERIIAVIDLDEENSSKSGTEDNPAEGEKNGRPTRRGVKEQAGECGSNSVESAKVVKSTSDEIVPGDQANVSREEQNDGLDEGGVSRLQGSVESGGEEMQTPVVKRGRGRPRKTPLVSREMDESSNSMVVVPETSKKRSRKKREDEGSSRKVPATESSNISEEEGLPSPAAFGSTIKRPRGGGRGGGRTPSGRGGGGSAKRGRGAMRKPFNKQQYFKQKNFEDSLNTYFEEDTRMSAADSSLSTPKVAGSSLVNPNDPQDSVSQSSHLSSTSVTMDSTQTSSLPARKKLKMEVMGMMEGKTEFTVDMLAEYEWPPPVVGGPSKERDTYMIQEQITEFLGVKSFKRKYPDLERRTVEMEERDYLIEKGLVTEKMCDLGVTAVYAVDVLDIMHQDFHEKYEQYKKFHREKMARDFTLRQKMNKAELGLGAREKAMRSVSKWNSNLNKSRLEERRVHMDLQNFTIQVPEGKRKNMTYPTQTPSLYPVSLVVGQFSEYYKTYTPMELACYPINTAIQNPDDLMKRLLEEKMRKQRKERTIEEAPRTQAAPATGEAEESAKSSSGSSSSDESEDSDDDMDSVDTSSSESDYDVHDDDVCCVCSKSQFTGPHNLPELFVKCAICLKMAHPSCIEMSSEMAKRAFQYQWQCVECKRCQGCEKQEDQQKMIYCHQCDRAYHIYCTKSLQAIPKGTWHCDICSICRKCGCRNPDGTNNKVSKMQSLGSPGGHRRPDWKHEFVKNEATGLKEHCGMLCVRCASSS